MFSSRGVHFFCPYFYQNYQLTGFDEASVGFLIFIYIRSGNNEKTIGDFLGFCYIYLELKLSVCLSVHLV
jgi:hypothetical protein